MKDESTKKTARGVPEQPVEAESGVRELDAGELETVTGGGAFDHIPRVKEYDYNSDIRNRA